MGSSMQRRYRRTTLFIIDKELWIWAQYKAKLLNYNSVSEYIFELLRKEKEQKS